MIQDEIKELAKKKNAIILAHYYQDEEIQDIANFIGDSLELSRKAAENNADIIVFCGVKFMGEVAKILSPKKKVLIPDMKAGCSLEESCKPIHFKKFLEKTDNNFVVTYINSSIEIKAMSDVICTSSSAEEIIRKIPNDKNIIFGPDKYLGNYLQKKTGREMRLWNGTCVVHENFSEKHLIKLTVKYPDAKVIAHPECPENLLSYAHHIGSTSSLLSYTKDNKNSDFIILTEPGIIHQMKKNAPGAKFYPVEGLTTGSCTYCGQCPYMRLNTLEKLYQCLINESPEIKIDDELLLSAKKPIENMFRSL
jgi:quinolinate synthase